MTAAAVAALSPRNYRWVPTGNVADALRPLLETHSLRGLVARICIGKPKSRRAAVERRLTDVFSNRSVFVRDDLVDEWMTALDMTNTYRELMETAVSHRARVRHNSRLRVAKRGPGSLRLPAGATLPTKEAA